MDNVKFIPYRDKADLIYSLNAGAIHWCMNARGLRAFFVLRMSTSNFQWRYDGLR